MFRLSANMNLVRQCNLQGTYDPTRLRILSVTPTTLIASCASPDHNTLRNKHTITFKPYVPPCYTDHDHKNMSLKRPMSPHLTIYAPTLPAMTSIAQRVTGAILTCYALILSGGTLFLSNGIETYVSIIQSLDLSRPSLFVIKIILGLPFCFHYYNGIRYCMWNLGRMLAIKDVYDSSYKSIACATATAALFALF